MRRLKTFALDAGNLILETYGVAVKTFALDAGNLILETGGVAA